MLCPDNEARLFLCNLCERTYLMSLSLSLFCRLLTLASLMWSSAQKCDWASLPEDFCCLCRFSRLGWWWPQAENSEAGLGGGMWPGMRVSLHKYSCMVSYVFICTHDVFRTWEHSIQMSSRHLRKIYRCVSVGQPGNMTRAAGKWFCKTALIGIRRLHLDSGGR